MSGDSYSTSNEFAIGVTLKDLECLIESFSPVPVGIWFINRPGEYYQFTALPEIQKTSQPYNPFGMRIVLWEFPLTEEDKEKAKKMGWWFVDKEGVWCEMSDGNHYPLLVPYASTMDKQIIKALSSKRKESKLGQERQ